MGVDKVADMDMVVGKVVNRVAHMVADIDFSIIFWAFLGEISGPGSGVRVGGPGGGLEVGAQRAPRLLV